MLQAGTRGKWGPRVLPVPPTSTRAGLGVLGLSPKQRDT